MNNVSLFSVIHSENLLFGTITLLFDFTRILRGHFDFKPPPNAAIEMMLDRSNLFLGFGSFEVP